MSPAPASDSTPAPPEAENAGPLPAYRALRAAGTLKPDPMQERAAEKLQELFEALDRHRPQAAETGWRARLGLSRRKTPAPTPKGLYIHGKVGRGKSMLMDLFFRSAPVRSKRRVHFHQFMIEVHDALHAWRKDKRGRERDPLPMVAGQIAEEASLLCFDEFHVTNIADAMILGRLFEALFDSGVVVVTTSNFTPDQLYKGGLQRERFLPFIDLLKARMAVLELDSETDYRLARLKTMKVYHSPLGPKSTKALEKAFADLTEGAEAEVDEVTVKGRTIAVRRAARGVAWFGFGELCTEARGAEDYIRIAERFHTVILDGVPKLNEDRRNEAKRFMTLIDTLYEYRVNLVLAAETAPHEIYRGDTHAFEFERTISRLMEMQSGDYLEAQHQGRAESERAA